MARPTERSIRVSEGTGAYLLACDGRHPWSDHVYYFYTKREVLRLWRDEHPRGEHR